MTHCLKKIAVLLLALTPVLVLLPGVTAAADAGGHLVEVDTRDYQGDWLLDGVWHSGPANLELDVGSHSLYIGPYQAVTLTVSEDGDLGVSNPGAIEVHGRTLNFQTTQVHIDTSDFQGKWDVSGVTASGPSGVSTLTLVRSSRYGLEVGGLGGRFGFEVDASGDISIPDSAAATAYGNRIVFNTIPVVVDTGGYAGSWSVYTVSHYSKGAAVIPLVADIPAYGLKPGIGTIRFAVGSDGEVRTDHPGATGGAGQLTLNTVTVAVDPRKFIGSWTIDQTRAQKFTIGRAWVNLPVGMNYQFAAGAWGRFRVDIDALGNVTVPNGVSATGGPGSLTFKTTRVIVDAREYPGTWSIGYIQRQTLGRFSLHLVPLTRYYLTTRAGENGFFQVDAQCNDLYGTHKVGNDTIYFRCQRPKVVEPKVEPANPGPEPEPEPEPAPEPEPEPEPAPEPEPEPEPETEPTPDDGKSKKSGKSNKSGKSHKGQKY